MLMPSDAIAHGHVPVRSGESPDVLQEVAPNASWVKLVLFFGGCQSEGTAHAKGGSQKQ